MNVVINGKSETIIEPTLADLCKRIIEHPHIIATAVNGNFVAVNDRSIFILSEGDKIEMLSPRQGG